MKKIFAILISLLFVVSTFGVASVMAPPSCTCGEDNIILPTKVSPGQEFIIKINPSCTYSLSLDDWENPVANGYIAFIGSPYLEGGYVVYRFKALKPGTIYVCNINCAGGCILMPSPISCSACEAFTISTSYYPMQQFMKILGLGQKD
jgi:hypothetical protein